jgi:hypothetical protein
LLLGHTKFESAARYLSIEVEDALNFLSRRKFDSADRACNQRLISFHLTVARECPQLARRGPLATGRARDKPDVAPLDSIA